MRWIKNNIGLIITIVVLLALAGGAVVFLLSGIKADQEADAEFKKQSASFSQVTGASHYPSDANIAVATEDAQWLTGFVSDVRPVLERPVPPILDAISFKSQLETEIAGLNDMASSIGVELPARYGFTFTAQRAAVSFPANGLPALTAQVDEIKALCSVLFENRVHSIDLLQRVKAYPEENSASNDYIPGKMSVTNAIGAVISPYLVSFRGFSSELGGVLSGLQNSDTYFVVKSISASPVTARAVRAAASLDMGGMNMGAPSQRGGARTASAPTAATPASAAGALETILEEAPMRFTLHLEVVKIPVVASTQPAEAATSPAAMQGM